MSGFLGGLFEGLMLDGTAVHKNFKVTGKGSGRMKQVAAEVEHLTKAYDERAERLAGIAKKMEAAFTGDVGDAAATSMLPMMKTLRYSGEQMDVTKALTEHQAQMWHDADNSVVEVPPAPEKPNAWSQGFKRLTFQGADADAADASYEAGVARRDAANQHNVDVYGRYSSGTSSISGSIPSSYPELRDTGGDIGVVQHKGTPGDDRKFGTPGVGSTAASSSLAPSGSVGSPVSGAPGVQGAGGLSGGGGLQPGAQTGVGGVGTNPAGGGAGGGTGGGAGGRPVGGAPIIGGPIGGPIGGGGDNTRRGPFRSGGGVGRTPTPGKPGGGSAGARLTGAGGPKGAAGAGLPKGGAVAGTGGAPKAGGAPLGAGKGVGAGAPGAGGGAAAQTAKAAGGVGGRGGGMAGMAGAGAGKGKEEDKEHKRADFLQENDPEGLFGTDEKTAPPVIGDPTFDPTKDPRAGK